MRINIKTNGRIKDKDIRALYMIVFALEQSTPRMREHNLRFITDRYGYLLVAKEGK
jgi:hypothetical protein